MGVASSVPTDTESCTPAYIVFRRDTTRTYTPYTFGNIQEIGYWVVDTAAASSIPTGTELCIPAYIVFRRDAAGTYTPNTFGNIWDLARWAFENASPIVATPTDLAPGINITAPVTAWNKTADEIKKIADEIFKLPIRGSYNNFAVDEKNIIKLTPLEIEVILKLFKEKPALIAEKLFPGLKKEHIQYLNHWGFIETVCQDLSKLETALKSYKTIEEALVENNEFLFVVKRLNNFLIEGLHHVSWRSSMSLLKFDDVGTWTVETAPIILEECLRSWLTSEKSSDSIRNFFIQTYLVQNYRRLDGFGARLISGATEVSSTDFLKGFTDVMNNELSGSVPSVFTKWVAKGVSYTHCKNALAQMGVEQVRKSSGQFYKNISPESFDRTRESDYLVPKDIFHHFRIFDKEKMLDSVMDDSLNLFEAPPPQTEDTNPLLTPAFKDMVMKRSFDPLSVYQELLQSLGKEQPITIKPSDSLLNAGLKESEFKSLLSTINKGPTYYKAKKNITLPSSKETSTPIEAVWTQTSETHITLVE